MIIKTNIFKAVLPVVFGIAAVLGLLIFYNILVKNGDAFSKPDNGFFKYFGHFMGPLKILAPLMFPIEIVSHLSRIISLSFRLFGNIKGDDLFVAVLLLLAPWVAPLPGFALMTFSAILQTFIFMILTYVYLSGAVLISEEH